MSNSIRDFNKINSSTKQKHKQNWLQTESSVQTMLAITTEFCTEMLTNVSKCNENNGTSIRKLIKNTACF